MWRVSLTEVVGSTTFSLFHSYDRILLRYDPRTTAHAHAERARLTEHGTQRGG
jgi:environmental stress-induced protein Ves